MEIASAALTCLLTNPIARSIEFTARSVILLTLESRVSIQSITFSEASSAEDELEFEEEDELEDEPEFLDDEEELEDFFLVEDDEEFAVEEVLPNLYAVPLAKETAPGISGVPFPLEFICPFLNKFSVCL